MKKWFVIAAALLICGCGTTKSDVKAAADATDAALKEADATVAEAAKDADAAVKDAADDANAAADAADAAVKDAAADANAAADVAEARMDKAIVQSVVSAHTGDIKLCYEDALKTTPDLKGKMMVKWVVGSDGAVKSSEIAKSESTIENEQFGNCLLTKVNQWTFPAPKDGGEVAIDYPFEFNTDKPAE
ncbi:MAG: AgmX/PglI C-terminal domain-containing protein [Proteobacteria bacterium]|nr:AgmX/PglI C-terminal domain-containing protein [Pseudomonadota bacterium]